MLILKFRMREYSNLDDANPKIRDDTDPKIWDDTDPKIRDDTDPQIWDDADPLFRLTQILQFVMIRIFKFEMM